jgi:hypothetical protein
MNQLNLSASGEDYNLIQRIVNRYEALYQRLWPGEPFDRLRAFMDITAVHLNGCPLRLKELLEARDLDFSHDMGGIARHLDRRTGKLTNCFLPRFYDEKAVK